MSEQAVVFRVLAAAANRHGVQRQRRCGHGLQHAVVRVAGAVRPVRAADPPGERYGEADEGAGEGEDGLRDVKVAPDEPEVLR